MKTFVDVGASDGRLTRRFLESLSEGEQDYRAFLIEPNPIHTTPLRRLAQEHVGKMQIIVEAADISQGRRMFYDYQTWMLSGFYPLSDTKLKQILHVPTFDFSLWCADHLRPTDYNILKMDIEGAEFEILPKMIEHKTLTLFHEIWLEEHSLLCGKEYAQRYVPIWHRIALWLKENDQIKLWLMPP